MKKIVSILLIIFMLSGCTRITQNEYINKLDTFFDTFSLSNKHRTNNNTKYYSFYLPSSIQEIEFDDTYHHLIFNDSDFTMNLNVNYILCSRIFSTQPDDPFSFLKDYSVYSKDNLSSDSNKYKFGLYLVDDDYYFSLYTEKFTFFGLTSNSDIVSLLPHLFEINDTGKLEYSSIIDAYYLGTTIDYSQSELDLFNREIHIPESGNLKDIVESIEKDNQENIEENEDLQ